MSKKLETDVERVLILNNLPAPYLTPFFDLLKRDSSKRIYIRYCSLWNQTVGWHHGQALALHVSATEILENKDCALYQYLGAQASAGIGLLKELIRIRPQLLILYGYTRLPQLLAIFWSLLKGIPFFLAGDANYYADLTRGWKKLLKRFWLGFLAKQATTILSVGTGCTRFWRSYGAAAEKIIVTGFPIDNEFFFEVAEKRFTNTNKVVSAHTTSRVVTLLYVGRLIARKNLHILLEALAITRELNLRLLIVGDGEERSALQHFAEKENLPVTFCGNVDQHQLKGYYAQSDILVLPAVAEPWGLVINEAMASGLAIIAHRNCGAAIDLVDHKNGYVLQSFALKEHVKALRYLMNDLKSLGQKQECSRQKISHMNFDHSSTIVHEAINAVFAADKG